MPRVKIVRIEQITWNNYIFNYLQDKNKDFLITDYNIFRSCSAITNTKHTDTKRSKLYENLLSNLH